MREFEEVCYFPEQFKLIKESIDNQELVADITGRLGISDAEYENIR